MKLSDTPGCWLDIDIRRIIHVMPHLHTRAIKTTDKPATTTTTIIIIIIILLLHRDLYWYFHPYNPYFFGRSD